MDGSKATPAEVTYYRYILKVRSTVGRTFVDLDIYKLFLCVSIFRVSYIYLHVNLSQILGHDFRFTMCSL